MTFKQPIPLENERPLKSYLPYVAIYCFKVVLLRQSSPSRYVNYIFVSEYKPYFSKGRAQVSFEELCMSL